MWSLAAVLGRTDGAPFQPGRSSGAQGPRAGNVDLGPHGLFLEGQWAEAPSAPGRSGPPGDLRGGGLGPVADKGCGDDY